MPQGDGKWFYGVSVENGRVKDEGTLRLRTGLRNLVEKLAADVRLTPQQDILLCDLDTAARAEVDRMLAEHGIARAGAASRWCRNAAWLARRSRPAAWPSPKSERALPGLVDQLEAELESWAWMTKRSASA